MKVHYDSKNENTTYNKSKNERITYAILTVGILLLCTAVLISTSPLIMKQSFSLEKPPVLTLMNSGPKPTTDNFNISTGYKAEPIYWNVSLPSAIAFDEDGNTYIAQTGFGEWFFDTPRILKIDPKQNVTVLADRMLYGPVTDIEFYKENLYVSHKGVISTIDTNTGIIKDIIIGLPSSGDHQNNQIAFGPDGRLYFGQGTATNSAVVGEDNIIGLQWPKYTPMIHDIPGKNITLNGINFKSSNLFSANKTDNATTGAYVPFRDSTTKGQQIKGDMLCSGCVISANPDGSDVKLVAWGLRNPYGLAFTSNGTLVISNNGADERGSRNIANDTDNVYTIDVSKPSNLGKYYGWPDFAGNGEPVTDPKFKSPKNKQPLEFLIKDHPQVVEPLAQVQVGPSLTQNAYSNGSNFGHEGMVFIGASGTFTPITHSPKSIDKGIVGHKVYLVNPQNGKFSDFLTVKADPAIFTPIGLEFSKNGTDLYVVDLGRLDLRDTLPNGTPLNMTVTWPYPDTGVIWKISKTR